MRRWDNEIEFLRNYRFLSHSHFFAVKKPSLPMVALFIRDNLEEVIGDEEGEEKEANFNPDERG